MATAESSLDDLHSTFQTRNGKIALSSAGVVLLFGSWYFLVDATGIVDAVNVPGMVETFEAMTTVSWDRHVWPTFSAGIAGFVIAFVLATGAAIGLTLTPRFQDAMMPYIVAGNSIPRVALAPIISIYLGETTTALIVIAAWVAFFPMFINAFDGFNKIHPDHERLLEVYDASVVQEYYYIRLPNGLPNVFDGMKIGILLALIGAIVAEFVIGTNALGGIGYGARTAMFHGSIDRVLGLVMVAGFFSTVLMLTVFFIQQRVVFWEDQSFFGGDM